MTDFKAGWAVVGNDGQKLGTIKSVGQNYILISRSGFASDLSIPATSIANVEHDTVHLNLTRREAEQMGWEPAPENDELETQAENDLHRHV